MSNPFVFIVGCSRSGTTLLQHMVAAHPKIAVIPETRWFVRWYEKGYGVTPDGFVTLELVSRLLTRHRLFRDIDLEICQEELEELIGDGHSILYQDFVRYMFDRYGEARGKPFVGNKTPGYVRRLKTIHSLWPQTRLVHIIRDGRDVCLSMIQMIEDEEKKVKRFRGWHDDPVSTTAFWWEWDVRLGREAGALLSPSLYHEVRYESLVAQPEVECSALCEFLGVTYDDVMLQHHLGTVFSSTHLSQKHPTLHLPITPGLRDWRTGMAADDIERFEAAAGDLLSELGYPLDTQPSQNAQTNAERLRGLFDGRPLPEQW